MTSAAVEPTSSRAAEALSSSGEGSIRSSSFKSLAACSSSSASKCDEACLFALLIERTTYAEGFRTEPSFDSSSAKQDATT
eukprot:CAMPEP_0169229350 /NCGR_PEP_ID=MMETSP1016-20121227/25343_1 /TAXON_ID=342587 /ORGANISM="Karlodinium micrum, Strain CCMP2283" /LENGTH=80 /DNA_ID=CAMNT_0009308235 /DNA_START=101 /DNA_END=343 /DNA_ORIENTATION=-